MSRVILIVTYIINRLPISIPNFKSYLEILQQFYPSISVRNHLVIYKLGCTDFIHIHSHQKEKLDHQTLKHAFIWYSST